MVKLQRQRGGRTFSEVGEVGHERSWKGPNSQILFLTQNQDPTGPKDGPPVREQMSIKRGCFASCLCSGR